MRDLSNPMNQAHIGWNDETGQPVVLDIEREMNSTTIIIGASGSGKTALLKHMLAEFAQKGFPILVIDNHGDIELEGFCRVFITEGLHGEAGVNPLHFNLFEIQRFGLTGAVERAVESISRAVGHMGVNQTSLLISVVLGILGELEVKHDDPETWSAASTKISEVVKRLRAIAADSQNPSRRVAESLVARLGSLAASSVFNAEALLTDEYLVRGGMIIDLTGLSGSKRALVADTILRMCFDRKVSEGHVNHFGFARRTSLLLVLDEAKILTEKSGNPDDPNHIVNIIATEGRKFGLGLIAASQLIRHFGVETLGSAACKIALGPIRDGRERGLVTKVFGLSRSSANFLDERETAVVLSSCDAREVLVRTKRRYHMAMG